jgi:Ca-activated chloride channel family protein
MKTFVTIVAFLTIFFSTLTPRAKAEATSIFILDASGSMWGRLPDRKAKIIAAREVMADLVGKLPHSVSAGLIAYGHRKKGDCGDIEIVQKVQSGGGAAIAAQLDRLVPRGKTPISDALKLAGEKLTGIEDPTTIVLISDGIETCNGDPCAVAEALTKASSKLNIHVVGYAVDAKARAQLQCVAEKGRGRYFTADDTGGLSEALKRVTESIKTATPLRAEEPKVEAPKVEAPNAAAVSEQVTINIAGLGTIRLKLGSWTQMPKYWKVLNPETGEVIAETKEAEIAVMPGQYQIAWRHLEHGAKEVVLPQVVDVRSGETAEAFITTGVQLVPPQGLERPYYWQLLPDAADTNKAFREREPAAWYWVWDAVPVPAGRYTLVMRQTEHGHQEVDLGQIDLAEGKLTQMPLDQGINLQWPEDWGDIEYLKLTDKAGHEMKMEYRGPVILAPGKYKLAVRLTEHGHTEAPFGEVTVPEKGFVDTKLTSGITFDTKIKGEFTVYAVNLDTDEEAVMRNRWGPMPLGAGRYWFDLKLGNGEREMIVPEMTIEPGQFITAKM